MELFSHPDLATLHPTWEHPDRPERIGVLLAHFPDVALGRPATVEELRRCHTPEYIDAIRSIDRPVCVEPSTVASETTYEAAALAAGTTLAAVERDGFALVRPPGHHAHADRAYGFCFFNNAALAVRHAQATMGVERVAIVDFDVHHGDGTAAIFWDDPTVLYVSLHQYGWPFFPGTGGPEEQSETTLNVALRPGSGDQDYLTAFERLVEPAVGRFDPQLVVVSAGFDAHVEDPAYLAAMQVTEAGFRELARRSAALGPRVAAVLEGGYNLATLPRLVEITRNEFGG